jgi:hypothetical protein
MEIIDEFHFAIGNLNAQSKHFTHGIRILRIKNMFQLAELKTKLNRPISQS